MQVRLVAVNYISCVSYIKLDFRMLVLSNALNGRPTIQELGSLNRLVCSFSLVVGRIRDLNQTVFNRLTYSVWFKPFGLLGLPRGGKFSISLA